MELYGIYILIYVPMILSIFIKNPKKQIQTIFFWIFILTLFRGLRWDLGTDWTWYEKSFNDISISNVLEYQTQDVAGEVKLLEPLWAFFMVCCKSVCDSYTFFLLLSNFVELILIYKISKMFSSYPLLVFVSYIASTNFFPVRQDLANLIFFYGFCLYIKKSSIKNVAIEFLTFFVHRSSIAATGMSIVLKRIRANFITYLLLLLVPFALANVFFDKISAIVLKIVGKVSPMIAASLEYYLFIGNDESISYSNPWNAFLINLLFFMIIWRMLFKKNKQYPVRKNDVALYPLLNSYVFMLVIQFVFLRLAPPLARICAYFSMSLPILMSIAVERAEKKNAKLSILVFWCFYLFYRFYRSFGTYPELHFPYRSIFNL